MIAWIRKITASPVFDGDDEKTRTAALLNIILLVGFAIVTLYLIALPVFFPQEKSLWALLRYPLIVGSWVLLKRGRVRAACAFFVVGMWVMQLFVWGGSGGLQSVSIAGVIVRVMITGLLLGGRMALLFAAVSLAENAVIIYAISRGLLPRPSLSYSVAEILIEQGIWSFLAAILLSLSISGLNQALRRARDELAERKRAEEALRASEERFSKAFNAGPLPMIITTLAEGRIVEVNETFLKASGQSREEVIGHTVAELDLYVNTADRTKILETLRSQGYVRNLETSYRVRGGEERVRLISADLIGLDGEQCILAAIQDITERKRAEEALRASEERFSKAFNASPGPMTINSVSDLSYIDVNNAFLRETGFERGDVIGRTPDEIGIWIDPEELARAEKVFREERKVRNMEARFRRKDGAAMVGIFSTEVITLDGEECALSVINNITERKRAEEALRTSEERFSKAFNASPNPMAITSLSNGRYIDVNNAFLREGGYTREEVIGRTPRELNLWVDADERARVAKAFREVGKVRNMEARFRRKDGVVRVGLFSTEVITLDGEECLLSVLNDITERKQAEEKQAQLQQAIHKSAMEWRRTFDSVESALLILDPEGRIIMLNQTARELSGLSYEEVTGRAAESIGGGQPWRAAAGLVNHIRESRRTVSAQTQDESSATAWEITASLIPGPGADERIIIVARDITGMVKLQESLRRSETMSAMGTLVAGVAHEVRNPLFSISATLDAFEARFGAREEYQQHINILRRELKRLNDLMSDLLEYGKPFNPELSQGSISEAIAKAIRSCEALVSRSNVRIVNRVGNDLAPILMDRRRVVQVFQNVIQNAIQHSAAGAVVTVEAEQIRQGGALWIHCRIGDSGPGFRAEELSKIFEPFFTRRRGGTGIGLSIVQRIMDEHGGRVSASNRPDGGAVVELRFQAAGQ
ncbi:MAG TPA: PAS domain S-box protein [Blastocatellia bacterium]|nr:PAS domain S-box protein [Blastocatellia bacterium]